MRLTRAAWRGTVGTFRTSCPSASAHSPVVRHAETLAADVTILIRGGHAMRKVPVLLALAAIGLTAPPVGATNVTPSSLRTLDGSGNNASHPTWGQAGSLYLRFGPANYADGIGPPVGRPDNRYVSNRVFNDVDQNLFSETGVTQWGWVWGQFMDHDLRPARRAPARPRHRRSRPRSARGLHQRPRRRSTSAARRPRPGPASRRARQQINTDEQLHRRRRRLRQRREPAGLAAGRAARRQPGQQRRHAAAARTATCRACTARGNAATAPAMDLMGALAAHARPGRGRR